MLHARFVIAGIAIGGEPTGIRHGGLVVVARAESAQMDWEVVIHTLDEPSVAIGTHQLDLDCVTGADVDGMVEIDRFTGPAVLVRTAGDAVVFRGTGPIDGIEIGMLRG